MDAVHPRSRSHMPSIVGLFHIFDHVKPRSATIVMLDLRLMCWKKGGDIGQCLPDCFGPFKVCSCRDGWSCALAVRVGRSRACLVTCEPSPRRTCGSPVLGGTAACASSACKSGPVGCR